MSTRIGVTGHQRLPDSAVDYIESGFLTLLDSTDTGTVISSLAAGADQLLTTIAVRRGFGVHAIVPCSEYDTTFAEDDLVRYRSLFGIATDVTTLDYTAPSEAAYMAAGETVVELCDILVAVWDGLPARGHGGTGDVIERARRVGRPVHVLWPPGTVRD